VFVWGLPPDVNRGVGIVSVPRRTDLSFTTNVVASAVAGACWLLNRPTEPVLGAAQFNAVSDGHDCFGVCQFSCLHVCYPFKVCVCGSVVAVCVVV
jgi:hypothetical protein